MLVEQIDQDMKEAMKAKDAGRLSTIRMLKAAAKNAAIEKKKTQLDDTELAKLIQKLIKQRQDSIVEFKKGNRPDLVEKEEAEVQVLSSYLPKSLSDGELDAIIAAAISEFGASKRSDMGKVMKLVMDKTQGRADGSIISKKVAEKLA